MGGCTGRGRGRKGRTGGAACPGLRTRKPSPPLPGGGTRVPPNRAQSRGTCRPSGASGVQRGGFSGPKPPTHPPGHLSACRLTDPIFSPQGTRKARPPQSRSAVSLPHPRPTPICALPGRGSRPGKAHLPGSEARSPPPPPHGSKPRRGLGKKHHLPQRHPPAPGPQSRAPRAQVLRCRPHAWGRGITSLRPGFLTYRIGQRESPSRGAALTIK